MEQVYTWQQLADMKGGKVPNGSDGKPMEIHHKRELAAGGENNYDNMEFMTFTEHRGKGNFKNNHPNIFPNKNQWNRSGSYYKLKSFNPSGLDEERATEIF